MPARRTITPNSQQSLILRASHWAAARTSPASNSTRRPSIRSGNYDLRCHRVRNEARSAQLAQMLAQEIEAGQPRISIDDLLRDGPRNAPPRKVRPLMLRTGQAQKLVEVMKASSAV